MGGSRKVLTKRQIWPYQRKMPNPLWNVDYSFMKLHETWMGMITVNLYLKKCEVDFTTFGRQLCKWLSQQILWCFRCYVLSPLKDLYATVAQMALTMPTIVLMDRARLELTLCTILIWILLVTSMCHDLEMSSKSLTKWHTE